MAADRRPSVSGRGLIVDVVLRAKLAVGAFGDQIEAAWIQFAGIAVFIILATRIIRQAIEQLEIQSKYAGYIARQQTEVNRSERSEQMPIPDDFDYSRVRGLSNEVRGKLVAQRPQTVGMASRISGVTPAAISLLLVYLKKRRMEQAA